LGTGTVGRIKGREISSAISNGLTSKKASFEFN
jgi:hypothetical protein